MNIREYRLDKLSVHEIVSWEAVNCIISSIVSLRDFSVPFPTERFCDTLGITFFTINDSTIQNQIDHDTDEIFHRLQASSSHLVTTNVKIELFKRTTESSWLPSWSQEKKIAFERWVIPLEVDTSRLPKHVSVLNDENKVVEIPAIERQRNSAQKRTTRALLRVFELAGDSSSTEAASVVNPTLNIDHIPPQSSRWEFEVQSAVERAGLQPAGLHNVRSRKGLYLAERKFEE